MMQYFKRSANVHLACGKASRRKLASSCREKSRRFMFSNRSNFTKVIGCRFTKSNEFSLIIQNEDYEKWQVEMCLLFMQD